MTHRRLVTTITLLAFCGTARADLIVNGSFEDGSFVPGGGETMNLPTGSTAMTGWEVIVGSIAWIGAGAPWPMAAAAGSKFLDLTGYRDSPPYGGVKQTITTVPGHRYQVSFSLGSSNAQGLPDGLKVSAAGSEEVFTTPTTGGVSNWYPHEMTFVATDSQTTVSFVGTTGQSYIGLDAVSVEDLDASVVVGGREWRQLTDTTYVTWNEVAAVCPQDGVTPCSGSILRSQDGASIDVTGWTWARNADVQALWEAIVQPGTVNFADAYSSYSRIDDPDIQQALSGEDGWFEPTFDNDAYRGLFGLSAELGATGAYRPWIRDAIPGNTDWVRLGLCCLAPTGRQSYTGAWLFRPYGGELQLQSLTLKFAEVAGCKSVTGTVKLTAPAPAGGVTVALADTLASATTPASVKLLEGASSKTFTVKSVAVTARQTGTVSATFGGTTLSQPLVLRPMGLLSLMLTPTSVAGSQPVAGTAKLECKAAPGPITVKLASSNTAVAHPVAASIVVPQGLQSTPFDVATNTVLVKSTATISGTANAITKSKKLTVTPAAVVSPTSLKFGNVTVGTTTAALNATLTNKGAVAFAIDSITVTGTYASWFPTTENCAASLAPGASCTISVRFHPLAAASRSAKVSIDTSATALPLTVSVSGTGATPP